ncbi:hypothetical protein N9371_04735 [Candidatus Pelagibacter sp.]|nr:hypothetical protein [Candidatus Pelagibacter sp.]
MNYYLGIFGGVGTNPSAALLRGKKIIAFAEEERFTRIKNAPLALPINSIDYCLKEAGIKIDKVKKISFGWDCPHQFKNVPTFLKKLYDKFPDLKNNYNLNLEKRVRLGYDPDKILNELKWAFAKKNQKLNKKIFFYKHHLSHAASTFYSSGYKESSILVLDGMGEEFTGGFYVGKKNKITCIKKFNLPNTLGGFYSTFTEFFGFKSNSEEGKLMALASFGNYSEKIQKKLNTFIEYNIHNGDFKLNPVLRFGGIRSKSSRFSDKFINIFGKPINKKTKISQGYKDLAFNVQWLLEKIVSLLVKDLIKKTNIPNLCLAGGVHMNCKLNGVLANLTEVNKIYVQPASSDNGVSLGAAMLAARNDKGNFTKMNHCYYGNSFSNLNIKNALNEAKIKFKKFDNIEKEVAKHLAKGKIIGWFQGRSEVGARALGNRSILANPLIKNMKNKLNIEVKHRENWRPFCPSVNDYKYKEYFGDVPESDFMILAFKIRNKYKHTFPSAVHIDGTARPQIVKKKTNKRFFNLIQEFEKITGHAILINTSFNVQGEPIVNKPSEAIRCFAGTGIDFLAIGNYLISK